MQLLSLFPLIGIAVAAVQIPFNGLRTLSHPEFNHTVRIRDTTGLCNDGARSFSGYIDNPKTKKHIFFYYFDARESPKTAPLTLWLNGGPGCSSALGLFMELGPCSVVGEKNLTTKVNDYSWTRKSNMLFVDSPVNVGFSYATAGVGTTEQAALDIHAFLSIFLDSFDEFKGRPFSLAGESYAGRYIPVFASEIVHQNQLLAKSNSKRAPINLKSVLIGNGLSDAVTMTTSYYDQACSAKNGIGRPVLDIKACITMQQSVKRCDLWLERVCREHLNAISPPYALPISVPRIRKQRRFSHSQTTQEYCQNQLEYPFISAEINPYNIAEKCTTLAEDLCYPQTALIKQYLDQSHIRSLLGVDSHVTEFQSCSERVGSAFAATEDGLAPTFFHLTGLLEAGIKVLIYVGKNDWICNYIGNYRMVSALDWSGKESFNSEPLRAWSVDGKVAGETKSVDGLTWLTIDGAGHMVPLDKPVQALSFFEDFIAGKGL